jgi:mannan endo-1,4-beta-mannosidase
VKRSILAILGLPAGALVVIGLLLFAKHSIRQDGHIATPTQSPAHKQICINTAVPTPFVGIAVNPPITHAVTSFVSSTRVHPKMVEFYTAFGAPFQHWEASQVVAGGSVPFIQWNPRHAPLVRIAKGAYDGYLRQYAAAVKAFKCRVVLSFGHEMNGNWYPWGLPRTTPAQFIDAWRRIHDIFTSAHVTNVIWAWDPDHRGSRASSWWPGAAYVDWVGLDGYQRSGQTFKYIFGRQLAIVRQITGKPVFIAETAVAPSPGQDSQIAGLFDAMSKYHLGGLVWFDINRKEPWRIDGRRAAAAMFRLSAASMEIKASI